MGRGGVELRQGRRRSGWGWRLDRRRRRAPLAPVTAEADSAPTSSPLGGNHMGSISSGVPNRSDHRDSSPALKILASSPHGPASPAGEIMGGWRRGGRQDGPWGGVPLHHLHHHSSPAGSSVRLCVGLLQQLYTQKNTEEAQSNDICTGVAISQKKNFGVAFQQIIKI